ncbi:Ionotropic receptor 228 [Frankliniella occidentalis]|nr:Ionotropic receptor 228 [Frankliniella occidentalis]
MHVLLCLLCAAVARAALPVPDTGANAKCLADYLSRFLTPAKAGLVVMGDDRHVAVLLREVPAETPRSLVFNQSLLGDQLLYRLQATDDIFLVAREGGASVLDFDYQIPPAPRVVVWTHSLAAGRELALTSSRLGAFCLPTEVVLAVSSPDGDLGVYRLWSREGCTKRRRVIRARLVNRCSPRGLHWQGRDFVISKICTRQQTLREEPSLRIVALDDGHDVERFQTFVRRVARSLRRPISLQWLSLEHTWSIMDDATKCRLDAIFSIRPFKDYFAGHFFSYEMQDKCEVVVVVPTGAKPQAFLQAVTVEFSTESWVATGLAALGVAVTLAAALALGGRPALGAALLQAAAPLLAQPFPGRPAHRPLVAVWLLMSGVLVAAYQGLVLRALTAPPQEIDSLEQLEQSGLRVKVDVELLEDVGHLFTDTLASRLEFDDLLDANVMAKALVDGRNHSAVFCYDHYLRRALAPWLDRKRLHLFKLGAVSSKSHLMITAGSPLEESLRRVVQRARSARMSAVDEFGRYWRRSPPEAHMRPLSTYQLWPAFLLLIIGNALGAVGFVLEISLHPMFARERIVFPFIL